MDAAKAAESSSAFSEIEGILAGVIDTSGAQPYTNLVSLNKPFSSIVSPVTRIIAIILPATVDKAAFAAELEASIATAETPGFKGAVYGWAADRMEHPSVPGGPANIFVALAGWESVESSKASESAPGMADHQAALAKFGGVFEVHYVPLEKA